MIPYTYVTLKDRCLIISYATHIDMNEAMCRFSEYRESPTFKGQIVPKRVILDDCLKFNPDRDYRESVGAHNIWGSSIEAMRAAPDLSVDELEIIKLVDRYLDTAQPYMVIGCVLMENETLVHELAHFCFMQFPQYQLMVSAIINQLPADDWTIIKSTLEKDQYDSSVFVDEAHAYMLCGPSGLENVDLFTPCSKRTKRWADAQRQLKEQFYKYMRCNFPLNILGGIDE